MLRQAQANWLALGAEGRAVCLNQFADALASELVPLAEALAVDTGRKTFAQFEAAKSIELIRMWAEKSGPILDALSGSGASRQVPSVQFEHRLIPYQMVAVISPWNVPPVARHDRQLSGAIRRMCSAIEAFGGDAPVYRTITACSESDSEIGSGVSHRYWGLSNWQAQ